MSTQADNADPVLKKDSISMRHIIFFVVAAAAPMTAVVGATPPAFAFGNGAGVPGAYIIAGILYLIFSRPFTTMSLYIEKAGAFYEYITQGLGRAMGRSGATVAVLAYFAIQMGIYALFSVFMSSELAQFGIDLPWWCWSLLVLVIVTVLGRYNIEVSGQLLGICMIGELLILSILDVAILIHGGGPEGITTGGFRLSEVFGPGLGISLVFVLGSYVGFEATAIFAEEARDPKRTIPRATYAAVILITVFYAASTWAIVQYYGPSQVQHAAGASLDNFYFNAASALLGKWSVEVMNLLLLTSLFACLLSFHNTLNRYFYSFGKKAACLKFMSRVHHHHGSPHLAGIVQAILVAIVILGFALSQVDPYTFVFSWMAALGVLAILAVQAMVMIAALRFFRKTPNPHSRLTTQITPLLALIGLVASFILVSCNLHVLTGSDSQAVDILPALVIGLGIIGALSAFVSKKRNPAGLENSTN